MKDIGEDVEVLSFPEGFFEWPRREISWEEATKGDIPFEWSEKDLGYPYRPVVVLNRPYRRNFGNKNRKSNLIYFEEKEK